MIRVTAPDEVTVQKDVEKTGFFGDAGAPADGDRWSYFGSRAPIYTFGRSLHNSDPNFGFPLGNSGTVTTEFRARLPSEKTQSPGPRRRQPRVCFDSAGARVGRSRPVRRLRGDGAVVHQQRSGA